MPTDTAFVKASLSSDVLHGHALFEHSVNDGSAARARADATGLMDIASHGCNPITPTKCAETSQFFSASCSTGARQQKYPEILGSFLEKSQNLPRDHYVEP